MAILADHKQILKAQSEQKTISEWVEFFGNQYTKNQIYSWCYHNGYKIKRISKEQLSKINSEKSRIYNINQDFFKTWSNEMAYVLGFWWADGCIYNGRIFDITTHKKDKYILKQFADLLQYEGHLYDYVDRQAARLNFSCRVIYDDIVKLGGKERKSLDATFPEVPQEFLSHFVRGYFDGDGSIWNVKGGRINSEFCSGSKDFLITLWEQLKQNGVVKGGNLHLCNASCYELIFGDRDTKTLGRFMYKDAKNLYLKRKRERFFDIGE